MSKTEPLPCPFCGWKNIRIIETPRSSGFFPGTLTTYCWCKVCGTQGPWAYNVKSSDEENYKDCVDRWNERDGIKKEELNMKIKPVGNRVLLEKMPEEEVKQGSLILPSKEKDKRVFKVVDFGDGDVVKSLNLSCGSTIYLDRYAGQSVTVDQKEYLIVEAKEILAIVNE